MKETLFVVHWSGDEDCDGRNDGPISIHTDEGAAVEAARVSAEEEAAKRRAEREAHNATGPDPVGGAWSTESIERIAVSELEGRSKFEGVLIGWDVYGERCACFVTGLVLS